MLPHGSQFPMLHHSQSKVPTAEQVCVNRQSKDSVIIIIILIRSSCSCSSSGSSLGCSSSSGGGRSSSSGGSSRSCRRRRRRSCSTSHTEEQCVSVQLLTSAPFTNLISVNVCFWPCSKKKNYLLTFSICMQPHMLRVVFAMDV